VLKNGNPRGHGGKRPGAGAKPYWFKEACKEALKKGKADEFLLKILIGEKLEPHVQKDGEVIYTEARVHDRIYAVEVLRDTGHGKPVSVIEVENEEGKRTALNPVIVYLPGQGQ
jgi:hypothetical protein